MQNKKIVFYAIFFLFTLLFFVLDQVRIVVSGDMVYNIYLNVFTVFTKKSGIANLDQEIHISNVIIQSINGSIYNIKTNIISHNRDIDGILKFPLISSTYYQYSIYTRAINNLFLSLCCSLIVYSILKIVLKSYKSIRQFRGDVPKPNLNNHLLALNFLRFIAASLVVIYHFFPDSVRGLWSNLGPQMVIFFFTLSGFVMIISHFNKKDETAFQFYKLRLARIYPLYLLALLVMLNSNTKFVDILLCVLLVQAFVPGHCLAINVPAWSLSAEAFYYLLFPFLLKYYRKSPILSSSLFILLSLSLSILVFNVFLVNFEHDSTVYHDISAYSPYINLIGFIMGNFTGLLYIKYLKNLKLNNFLSSVLIFIFVSITLLNFQYGFIHSLFFKSFAYENFSSCFVFALLILGFSMGQNSFIIRILQNNVCIRLGDISYSIYILQSFVFNSRIVSYPSIIFLDSPILKFCISFLILVIVSWYTFSYLEVPAKKYLMRKNVLMS